jgi:Bacterial dipeptidyl-peptidase Sh3 domain
VGRVIASHYAEPVDRQIAGLALLRSTPSDDGAVIRDLQPGEAFAMLDDSLGWAWGYAGKDRRVGYVHSSAIAAS